MQIFFPPQKEPEARPIRFMATAATKQGPWHDNDDRYILTRPDSRPEEPSRTRLRANGGTRLLAAVADGVSSTQERGRIAAFAVERLGELFCGDTEPQTWLQAINRAASSIYLDPSYDTPMPSGATTLSFLLFENQRVFAANVGDSPILRIRGGELTALYTPHTRKPQPPLAILDGDRDYGALTNFIGNPYYSPQLENGAWFDLEPFDRYLVCSDGAAAALTRQGLLQGLAGSSRPTAGALLDHCAARLRDDGTLLLIEVLPRADGPISTMLRCLRAAGQR